MTTPRPRRTQAERRDATIEKLITATVDCLATLGYAGTSTGAICHAAGLSQGALFRHFPTRRALLVKTAEHVARQQAETFRARFAGRSYSPDNLAEAVGEIGRLVSSHENRTWHELTIASRADDGLRQDLQPAIDVLHQEMFAAAATYFGDALPADELGPVLSLLLDFFDGMVLSAHLVRRPELADRATRLLTQMLVTHIQTRTGATA